MSHLLSATDTFPDDTPTQLQPQPAGDWCFSAIEDRDSSDDSAPGFFAPTALVSDVQAIPTMNAATAAGHPSAFFLHKRYDPAPAADSHLGALLAANPNLTSYTHAMTRLLPPTPIEELVPAANPNLTSYTHTMTRLVPLTPIEELMLAANPNFTSRRRPPHDQRPHSDGRFCRYDLGRFLFL